MAIKNIVIGIAIIILTMFVVIYGINTFYERPEYANFCGEFKTTEFINTSERCEEIGGKWRVDDEPRIVKPTDTETIEGYCDRDYECRKKYEDSMQRYSRNVFLIAIPLGIIIITLGAYFFALEAVGAGLMGGGVGTIIYGSIAYWSYAENWFKFILSLIGLIVLIWFAYWFNERKGKK